MLYSACLHTIWQIKHWRCLWFAHAKYNNYTELAVKVPELTVVSPISSSPPQPTQTKYCNPPAHAPRVTEHIRMYIHSKTMWHYDIKYIPYKFWWFSTCTLELFMYIIYFLYYWHTSFCRFTSAPSSTSSLITPVLPFLAAIISAESPSCMYIMYCVLAHWTCCKGTS